MLKSLSRFAEALASTIIGVLFSVFAPLMSSKYQLDLIFRRTLLLSKLFTKSWGPVDVLQCIKNHRINVMSKGLILELIERKTPKMVIKKHWTKNNILYMEGYFKCPLAECSPFLFPSENVAIASWRGLFPADKKLRRGLVVHLAGTGDHSFFRREMGLANDLLKDSISSILLENPFYGTRKPKQQFRSSLLNVSDLFVMGAALMAECCFLLKWASQLGHQPLALSGVSMGGHMASLAATNIPTPTALIPLLSWTSGAPVYTFGALSEAINWPVLEKELNSLEFIHEIQQKIPNNDWFEKLKDNDYLPTLISPVKRFMWILMEEYTNLAMYPIPSDPKLVHAIVAEDDAYVLRLENIPDLRQLWPGSMVQVVPGKGHVETYLSAHSLFRDTIRQTLMSAESRGKIIVPENI